MTGLADALRYEWVRITSLRSTFGLIIGAALANLTIPASLAAFTSGENSLNGAVMLTGGLGVVPELPAVPFGLLGILGAMAVGQEYQHGTMRPTLTAVPSRTLLVVAKATVVASIAGIAALICLAANFIVVSLLKQKAIGIDGEPQIVMSFIWVMMVWSVLGMGVGLLIKHLVGAISALIMWPLVGETTITMMSNVPNMDFLRDIVPYLPCRAANSLLSPADADRLNPAIGVLSPAASAATFLTFSAVVLGLAWMRFLREDV